ncbi:ABC transporter ATP-binding protein [Desemzia sp. RIT804]|uniref:ABC transporter ATP-binding protein n=1 Tax=Desemzia sp. RIT 804 TaxID=2810209 RepID=UPI00194E7C6C|nr:ABC transporter ATP-binding protein [Desemzia sp. RIT 804]MBM6614579.1 ABC transporter ATP-binding protein [Desemzia sp. RIT 804]
MARMRYEQLSKDEVKKAPKLTRNFINRIFHYLNPYRSQYLLSLFLVVVSAILSVIPTLLTGEMIDKGIIGGNFKLLLVFAGASFFLLIVSSLVTVLSSYLSAYIGQHVSKDMSEEMYGHLQQMSHQFFTSNKQGEIQSRMMQDISGVESVITQTFTTLMSNIMTLAVAFVAMMGKDIRLAIIALVIVPLMIIPMKKAGQARWDLTMQARKEADKTQQLLNESLSVSGQLLTKLFVREENEMREYQTLNTNLVNLNIRERVAGRGFRGLMQVITNMGPLILYVVGGYLMIYRQSSLTIGDITVMVTLLGRLIFPIDSLMNVQVDLVRSTALFNRIFEYLDMKPEIISVPNAVKRKTLKGDLEFEQVHFQYSKEKAVLHDLSFHVEPGSSLALVGPSGAGKSTITNLIPRLFDVTSGQIKIDGTNIKDYDLASLRLNIGVVTQETYLFNGTIRENLLIANPEATDDDLILALEKANLTNFLKNLPEGLDTIVGNRGMKLSGGEKQRVSIARVILKQPAILIFDEATSSLDSLSEEEIQKEIVPLMDSCTTIMVAHRLSTVRHAEQIIVLEEGSIQQQGTHEELIKQPGLYQRLYQTQMGKDKRI